MTTNHHSNQDTAERRSDPGLCQRGVFCSPLGISLCFALNRSDDSSSNFIVRVSPPHPNPPPFPCVLLSSLLFYLPFSAPCSWMGGIDCQGFGRSINRLWKRAELASTHSPCITVAGATTPTPTGKKQGAGRGVQWRLPLFLTLVRKPSVLLRGEWHLLITIEALWEVPPSTLWQRFAPVPQ